MRSSGTRAALSWEIVAEAVDVVLMVAVAVVCCMFKWRGCWAGDRLVRLFLLLWAEERGEGEARVERAKKGEVDLAGSDRLRRSERGGMR